MPRIMNTSFFATSKNGERTPVATFDTVEPEVPEIPVDPEVPDGPTVPVDGVYASLVAPVVTRLEHTQHVYVDQGTTLTLKFRSDIKATLCGLYGFEDMVETRDPDGRTITITWNVSANEPAVTRHFGCRAVTAGGQSEVFTLVHIGKVEADVFEYGLGTARTTLKSAAEDPGLTAGCTLVIKDGFYDDLEDYIQIGSLGLSYPAGYYNGNLTFPNGVHTTSTIDGETVVDVSKFSCIIAETPLGVIVDSQHKFPFALHMQGNDSISTGLPNGEISGATGNQNDGQRSVRGILFMGFAVRGGGLTQNRTKKCGFVDCSAIDDNTLQNPKPNTVQWTGDGSLQSGSGHEDSLLEGCHLFGNHRYMALAFFSHKMAQRKTLMTSGAAQTSNEGLFNAISYYNSYKYLNNNCWNLDSAEYISGAIRFPNLVNSGFTDFSNPIDVTTRNVDGDDYDENTFHCYGSNTMVKGLNDVTLMWGHAYLNGGAPALIHNRASGSNTLTADYIGNSYCWYGRSIEFDVDPFDGGELWPSLWGGNIVYDGLTIGRNDALYAGQSSALAPGFNPLEGSADVRPAILNVAVVSPSWDYTTRATDTVFYSDGSTNRIREIGGILVVDAPPNINTSWTSRAINYTSVSKAEAVDAGIKYITRVEPGVNDARPIQDLFRTKGRYLTWWNNRASTTEHPNFYTEYNVNWYNRLSVSRVTRERQEYESVTNGLTLTGNLGCSAGATSRADYYQTTFGTTVDVPENCPYVINVYAYVFSGVYVLTWDTIPDEYIGSASGYNIYVDGVLNTANVSLNTTEFRVSGLSLGSHTVQVEVIDAVRGNSGLSKLIPLAVNPVIPDVEFPDTDPTDPVDPGEGDGGDVGTPGGNGVITIGDAPVIIRRFNGTLYTSPIDFYAPRGQTTSITYIADRDCTLLPKLGYEDMAVSYSTNGREMTLTWTVPNDEPGDSWWFGCEAWVYGGDNIEAYQLAYDRIHVNKTANDVEVIATKPVLQDALENRLTSPGKTVVVPDSTYTEDRDCIHVGFENYLQASAPSVSNGLSTSRNVNQNPGDAGQVTGQVRDVSKYSVFMSATPLGSILERGRRGGSIGLNGDLTSARVNQSGFRSVRGIKIKGFGLDGSAAFNDNYSSGNIRIQLADTCSIDACYYVNDLLYTGNDEFTGDSSCAAHSGDQNCSMTYGGGIGNHRLLNSMTGIAQNCEFNTFWSAAGATQIFYNQRCQVYVSYPARNCHYRNCFAVDGALYAAGARSGAIQNYAFNSTNGDNDNINHEACVMFNDVRGFIQINSSGGLYGQSDKITDCVGFHSRRNPVHGGAFEMLRGGPYTLNRCTFGRNEVFSQQATIETNFQARSGTQNSINGLLVNQPNWDYNNGFDTIFYSTSGQFSSLQNIGVAGSQYPAKASVANATTNFVTYTSTTTQTSGFKYWMRIDQGSAMFQEGLGARDVFCKRGRYGVEPMSQRAGWGTVYNGRNGNPYVNAISRSPYLELRDFWRTYSCNSNGVALRGNVGWAEAGVHPIDYLLREGVTPTSPLNTPYIEDIYVYGNDAGDSVLAWRPICPAYRNTITGYDIYVDNQLVATNVAKQTTSFVVTGINSGTRAFNIVVKDSVYGDSGKSRTVTRVVS